MTSNCLLKRSLVKETTFLSKVGCEFSRHSSPCPSWVGEGGRQSLDRAGHGNTGFASPHSLLFPVSSENSHLLQGDREGVCETCNPTHYG